MKYAKTGFITFLFVFGGVIGGLSNSKGEKNGTQMSPDSARLTYVNPVFQPVLADPTIVRSGGSFYAYGTEDSWGT